jgi:hypothetical protein
MKRGSSISHFLPRRRQSCRLNLSQHGITDECQILRGANLSESVMIWYAARCHLLVSLIACRRTVLSVFVILVIRIFGLGTFVPSCRGVFEIDCCLLCRFTLIVARWWQTIPHHLKLLRSFTLSLVTLQILILTSVHKRVMRWSLLKEVPHFSSFSCLAIHSAFICLIWNNYFSPVSAK